MDLRTYIDTGAVECYLLGLASAEEETLLYEMRRLYPELESEIAVTAFKLEEAAMEGGLMPPAEVWDRISRRVRFPPNRYMKVSTWWRCAFIALCMLVMALLASNIYFYRKYHEMEELVLRQQPSNQLPPASTK